MHVFCKVFASLVHRAQTAALIVLYTLSVVFDLMVWLLECMVSVVKCCTGLGYVLADFLVE